MLITPLPWGWHCTDLGQRSSCGTAGWRRLWEISLGAPGWKAHRSTCVSSSSDKVGVSFTKKLLFCIKQLVKQRKIVDTTKSHYSLSGCSSVRSASVIIAKTRSGSQSPEREDFSRLPLACWAWDKAQHRPYTSARPSIRRVKYCHLLHQWISWTSQKRRGKRSVIPQTEHKFSEIIAFSSSIFEHPYLVGSVHLSLHQCNKTPAKPSVGGFG